VLALALAGLAAAPAAATAASPFRWRGVVQGQYGPQFSSAERVRLLRFEGRIGFNAYVHAPKDDPYQRLLWRDPYPPQAQVRFDAEIALAARLGIEWIPNVSPGTASHPSPAESLPAGASASPPLCFSCPEEIEALLAKLEPFRRAGADTFMVSFDDVQRRFADPLDTLTYGDGDLAYGRANGDLLTRLDAALRDRAPGARLLTVGADYAGTRDSDYLRGLRETLAPGIEVMWTGRRIQSKPFEAGDADAYAGLVGRAPVVWENWTATDLIRKRGSPPTRIFLGPYRRRAGLAGHVRGFFFNTANEEELNMLPFATAAQWLRRPRAYRPRRAFLRAARELGRDEAASLRAFAECSYSSTLLPRVEAPTFDRLSARFLHSGGRDGSAAAKLRHELRLLLRAGARLHRVRALRPFLHEARPFLRSAGIEARSALLATALLQSGGHSPGLRRRLQVSSRRSARDPAETCGSRSRVFGLTGNRVDGYVKRALAIDRARRR
jgi:hyaluronoglucosaminidase